MSAKRARWLLFVLMIISLNLPSTQSQCTFYDQGPITIEQDKVIGSIEIEEIIEISFDLTINTPCSGYCHFFGIGTGRYPLLYTFSGDVFISMRQNSDMAQYAATNVVSLIHDGNPHSLFFKVSYKDMIIEIDGSRYLHVAGSFRHSNYVGNTYDITTVWANPPGNQDFYDGTIENLCILMTPPTTSPTESTSKTPSMTPSTSPTHNPSSSPTNTAWFEPSTIPAISPTSVTNKPSISPTMTPSLMPTSYTVPPSLTPTETALDLSTTPACKGDNGIITVSFDYTLSSIDNENIIKSIIYNATESLMRSKIQTLKNCNISTYEISIKSGSIDLQHANISIEICSDCKENDITDNLKENFVEIIEQNEDILIINEDSIDIEFDIISDQGTVETTESGDKSSSSVASFSSNSDDGMDKEILTVVAIIITIILVIIVVILLYRVTKVKHNGTSSTNELELAGMQLPTNKELVEKNKDQTNDIDENIESFINIYPLQLPLERHGRGMMIMAINM